MSMRPNCSTAVVISRAMSPGQVTSVAMKRAIPPSAAISATRLSPSVTRRPAATIVAPARAKASAAARPMPLPAPVMTAILPAKSAIGRSLMVQDGGALDDAFQLRRRVEHAEDGGPVALQPRGAERREDIGRAVIVQLARLQGISHRGAESPRMAVIVAFADDLVAQAIEPAVELQGGAEAAPRLRVVERQGQRLAHQPGRSDGEVEPRQMRVAEDLADAVSVLADQPGERVVIFDLARGVRAIAAFVLEALDADVVARAVRQEAGHEEAGDAGSGPGEGEEAVGLRHREEPFVAGQQICPAVARRLARPRRRLRLAQIRAALLLGHGIADGDAGLLTVGQRAPVVAGRQELLAPRRESGLGEAGLGGLGQARWA